MHMEVIMMFLLSIGIGAVIGGLTNFVAISMLFRPFKPLYIGSWKLPFTPGVIPKRQEEIAYQLGVLVEKQLVSVDRIREKVHHPLSQKKLEYWLNEYIQAWLASEHTLVNLLRSDEEGASSSGVTLEDTVEKMLAPLADFLVLKIEAFLYSEEGEDLLYQSIQQLIAKQGMLANMLGAFLVKEKIVDKLRPVFLSALRKPTTKGIIQNQLAEATEELLNKPVGDLLAPFSDELSNLTALRVPELICWIDQQLPKWFEALNLAELVSAQVLSFPLERLEELIRNLANRELKMITYLGALLGGIIGFIQALLLFLFFS